MTAVLIHPPRRPHAAGTAPDVFAGVDLGGTKVSVTLADHAGLVAQRRAPVQLAGGDDATIAEQVAALIEQVLADAGCRRSQLRAIGVASTGPFVRRGSFLDVVSPNLCGGLAGNPLGLPNAWTRIPLQEALGRRFPEAAAVTLQNDAVAALQAERLFGAARGSNDCAYGTWSTGIGFGLCVDGRLLAGKGGNAGHAGHAFISHDDSAEPCGCGNRGDAESLLGGTGLRRRWGLAPAQVFLAAAAGDACALARVDAAVALYAQLLHQLVVTLDLELIVLGGSVFTHNQALLLPRLRSALTAAPRAGLPALTRGVRLEPSALAGEVTDLGALALALPASAIGAGFRTSLPAGRADPAASMAGVSTDACGLPGR